MKRLLALALVFVGLGSNANAQGYSRGYSYPYYGQSGYAVGTRTYGYANLGGARYYGTQAGPAYFYFGNNGYSGYGVSSGNASYYRFNAPSYGRRSGFQNFPRVGF